MIIKFWGVRGSVPAPGKQTSYYGGNTTCVTIETEKTFIIIDAGTGIRNVSQYVFEKKLKSLHIIFTHYHWDHLQGLPFFSPIFNPKIHIDIYGKKNVSTFLSHQMKQPFFPADYKNLPSDIKHYKIKKHFFIDDIEINTIEHNHPSSCIGLKFKRNKKFFVFMTDNELNPPYEYATTLKEFSEFITGSQVFIHDAQYLNKELKEKRGWGHSTFSDVIKLAKMSHINNLIFTHHDPMRNDNELHEIIKKFKAKNPKLKLKAARENLTIKI